MPGVRPAAARDVPDLAAVLAAAFDDDPVVRYIFPGQRRRRRAMPTFFGIQLKRMFLPAGTAFTTDDLSSAALWMPPGQPLTGGREALRMLPLLRLLPLIGRRLPSTTRLLGAIAAHHPRTPHWYLAVLGTDPSRQRQGLGSAVLEPVLRRCDDDAVPAYLESSKESNVPFYRRHGFEVTEELRVRDAPPLWLMWREPRPQEVRP